MAEHNRPSTPSRNSSHQSISSPSHAGSARHTPAAIDTSHRASLSENRSRFIPPSPRMRTTRQPSISNDAFTELINNPPVAHETDGQFTGRDWWTIKLKELVDPSLVHWAELDTTVEEASELLIGAGPPNVVLIRRDASSMQLRSTFDYKDLNTFLLLALGLAHPPEGANSVSYNETVRKIRQRKDVTLREMQDISNNQDYKMLSQEALLSEAVGLLAGGLHRIIVVKEESQEVVGVLTQLRLVRFFWEQGRNFGPVHDLFQQTLKDLGVGPRVVQSINGDRELATALTTMANESISSLPVVDNHNNVIGNISQVDVKLLTKSTSLPLLSDTCIHFISIILNERGMQDGKDSFPVFYMSPQSTLAAAMAKLVATRSHRMWITDADAPMPPSPATPGASLHHPAFLGSAIHGPPYTSTGSAISAASLPGQITSGRLVGVISLTDVLNLFARASGINTSRPDEARSRRRSSSSSLRGSMDSSRASLSGIAGPRNG